MTADSDEVLLRRWLGGDESARRDLAAALIDAIQREVSMVLGRRARDSGRDPRQEVLDLVQDVLVCLFERDGLELRRWDPARGRSLRSFVRLIARRRVARVLGQRRGNPWAETPIEISDGDPDDRPLERLEHRASLDELLDRLYAQMDTRDAELFEMLFVDELDNDEVGRRMGMTSGAINAWRYRMRKLARAIEARIDAAAANVSSSAGSSARRGGGA